MTRRRKLVRLEDLVGRRVRADGRVVGRIEEVRAERRGAHHEITEFLLGSGALVERWSLVGRLFGRKPTILAARWDQIDISRPDAPRLTCAVEELRIEHPHGR